MTKQSYFWATPSGPINLMKAEDMPVKPDHPCEQLPDRGCPICAGYELDLWAAKKENAVPIQDQFQARLLIYIKNNSEDIKPDTIYGPFSLRYEIQSRCCANPNLAIGACERDCDAYESFTKTKGPSKVAILYDDTPEKEPQEQIFDDMFCKYFDYIYQEKKSSYHACLEIQKEFTITRKQ